MPIKGPGQTIVYKGIILVLVPLVFGVATLVALFFLLHQAELETETEVRYRTIGSLSNELGSNCIDALTAVSVYGISKDSVFAERYDQIKEQNERTFKELQAMLKGMPGLAELTANVQAQRKEFFALLDQIKSAVDEGKLDTFIVRQAELRGRINDILVKYVTGLKAASDALRDPAQPPDSDVWRTRLRLFCVFSLVGSIIISLLLALFFTKSITQRIELLQENATLLANKEKLHALLSGNDEIAVLDRAFHTMADTLEEAARRERALVDNALDVICTVDAERAFAAVSPAALKTWGYAPEELVGKPVESIIEQASGPLPLDVSQLSNQSANLQFESLVRHKNGSAVSMLWSAHWSDLDRVFFCVAHDITDRKAAEEMLRESEARLRTVMESMPVALVIVNDRGYIEVANKTTEDLFGYKYSDLAGESITRLLPDEKEQGEKHIKQLADRYLKRHGELSAQKNTGDKIEVELSLSEIYFRGERNFLVAMLDINERHQMELLKQEFINMMSNDLKQPLISVRSVLSALGGDRAGKLNEKGKMLVDQSERETVRLVKLIDELLDAERLQAGKMKLEIREHSLKQIVARSLASVALLAEKNHVTVEDRCTDRKIRCDDTKVIQLLINLLSNSLKFSPAGSTISVDDRDAGEYWQIAVSDQGRGIPEALRQGIFEKFVQVEAGDARVKGGTGLGLAICKAIVEGHGGTIGVDSEEGKGSTFWFRLPKA